MGKGSAIRKSTGGLALGGGGPPPTHFDDKE